MLPVSPGSVHSFPAGHFYYIYIYIYTKQVEEPASETQPSAQGTGD